MPIYVYSGASGANDGTSWTDAYTSIASATSAAAGSEVWVASDHDQDFNAATTLDWSNGTLANPVKIISVDRTNDTYLPGAIVRNGVSGSGFYNFDIKGHIRSYGVSWRGDYIVRLSLDVAKTQHYEDGTLFSRLLNGDVVFRIGAPFDGLGRIVFRNVTIDQSAKTNWDALGIEGNTEIDWAKITINPATSANAYFISSRSTTSFFTAVIRDSDLSAFDDIISPSPDGGWSVRCVRCKIKSGAGISSAITNARQRLVLEACDDGTITVPALSEAHDYYGSTVTSLTRYRTGGADDGEQANAHSWEMTTNANALEIFGPHESPPLARWVEPDASISGATAQGIFTSTRCAPLATPAALTTDSGSTWNGTGVGTKQKISHTLTNGSTLTVYVASGGTLNNDDFWIEVSEPDQVGGPVVVRCFLAKPSTTVFVDPLLEIV